MSNTIFITANWTTGALSQQTISRQYDNNRYAVQFIGYPEGDGAEELDLYLLVWMSTAPGQKPGEITPIQLNSDQWYISNYFTQQVQVIKFQLCVLNEAGTYEAHSPIFSGRIGDSLEHNGTSQDIDVSTLFDAYREYIEELIIGAGAVIIDPAPTQGSNNAVQSGGVYEALQNIDVTTDTTLSVSGKPADAKAVGDALDAVKDDLKEIAGGLPEAQKNLIITILRNGLYSSDQSENINTLEDLFFADIPATSISLNTSSISLIADSDEDTYALTATVRPVYSTDAVTWTSSNDTVATVSDAGMVTAISSGTAIITATAGNVFATCQVVISADEINSISAVYTQSGAVYTTDALSVLKNDLVVTANYGSGTHVTIPDYDYILSGTLTAGTSTITVEYAGKTTTFIVNVTTKNLDTIAYEDKSFRDIFMTGNSLTGTDFENGLPTNWSVKAGSPEVTTEDYVSATHSIKLFGNSSAQYSVNGSALNEWSMTGGKTYYDALNAKCTRYVSGSLGMANFKVNVPPIMSVTNGWVISSKVTTAQSDQVNNRGFIGSYSSADLDGYIDDIVHICMSDLFTVMPTKNEMDALYEEYCMLRNGGVS